MTRRVTVILFIITFANFLGGTIVLPTLPLYAQRHFDADPGLISLILASYFVAQFLAAPFLGRASDRWGRRPVLLVSLFGTFLSFVMLITAGSIELIFLARVLDGITGGNVIVAQAYVTDVTPRSQRTRGLGVIFAAFGLGYIVGPAVGGLTAAIGGDTLPFYIGAVIAFITVVITYLFLAESLPADERRARTAKRTRLSPAFVIHNTPLMLILLIGFMAQFSIAILQSTIALFGEFVVFAGQDTNHVNLGVGLMLTGIGVGQFTTQLFLLKPMIERFGERRLVVLGAVLRAMGMFAVAVFVSPLLVGGVGLLSIAVASGLMMPSLQALATTSVSEDISGGVLGVYNASTSLGIIVGTFIGGQLFNVTPQTPFLVAGMMLLLAVGPAIALMHRARPVSEGTGLAAAPAGD